MKARGPQAAPTGLASPVAPVQTHTMRHLSSSAAAIVTVVVTVVALTTSCAEIQAANERLMRENSPEGQCDAGDGEACDWLGWQVQKGERPAPPTAVAWFEKACAAGHRGGCNSAGWHHHKGLSGPVDEVKASAFFARACPPETPKDGTLDEAARYACGNLGYQYEKGLGVEQDFVRAVDFYGRSCAGGMPSSCFSLGIGYERGRGIAQDLARARELYEATCAKNEPKACGNLGVMLLDGRGGPFDLPRAHTILGAECDRGDALACTNLGYVYGSGVGVATDACRSRTLHEKSCSGGAQLGCANLGANLMEASCPGGDVERGRVLVEQACLEHGMNCGSWATEIERRNARDHAAIQQALERGCANDESFACLRLGTRARDGIGQPKDLPRAMDLLEKACRRGRPEGCREAVALGARLKVPTLPELQARACALAVGPC